MQFKAHSDGRGEFTVEADDIWEVAEQIALDEGVDGQQDDPCWDGFSFTVNGVMFGAQLESITEFGGTIEVTNDETNETRVFEL